MNTRNSASGSASLQARRNRARDVERFLERTGLLGDLADDPPDDGVATDTVLERRMRFIADVRSLGYELHEIRDLMALMSASHRNTACNSTGVAEQIGIAEQKIVALMRLRRDLLRILDESTTDPQPMKRGQEIDG